MMMKDNVDIFTLIVSFVAGLLQPKYRLLLLLSTVNMNHALNTLLTLIFATDRSVACILADLHFRIEDGAISPLFRVLANSIMMTENVMD